MSSRFLMVSSCCLLISAAARAGDLGGPGGNCPQQYDLEFSIDIGSDTEFSDPVPDGNEVFDPGDVYLRSSPPLPPCGLDGFKDDMSIFFFDPSPSAPDCGPFTGAPPGCSPCTGCYQEFFDLDGHDQLEVDLRQWIPPNAPLPGPLPRPVVPSGCIHDPRHLLISFDDDRAPGWALGNVPVTSPSPAGVSSYGTAAGVDEVINVELFPLGGPLYGIGAVNPYAAETGVHVSLAPNPTAGDESDDDDVDSLDVVASQDQCPIWYFTADHEAHLGLDPGDIYERTAAGPVVVINEVIHLGIPDATDIDAFEFTWLNSTDGTSVLAILFSVDDNDPCTAANESGGLMPNMLYGSFMTGFSFPVLDVPLEDDIDALAIWCNPFEEEPEACCLQTAGCIMLPPSNCHAAGGTPMGPGSVCNPPEACCLPGGGCLDIDPACCSLMGGMPQGAGTTCSTTICGQPDEACCLQNGTCINTSPPNCVAMGGTPEGPGTVCTAPEGCCLPVGAAAGCVDLDPLCCVDQGGIPQGAGSACTGTIEACCLPNGTCVNVDPLCCDDQGGTPQGPGSSCSGTVEACCLPGGLCSMLDKICCLDQGGTPQGSGSVCNPNLEACCLPDGTCVDVDPLCCDDMGGIPQGPGSNCADVICGDPLPYRFEFSVDIGSDTELSDPFADGDEGFDPGDVYWWQGPPVTPPIVPCGRDGFKDDLFIFGFDPFPNPPDCGIPPVTRVPVGNNCPPTQCYFNFFDLDGHDQVDTTMTQFDFGAPIPQFPSQCIYEPKFLMVSFDDDRAPGWPAGDVPVTVPSPAGVTAYGETATQDEVIGVNLGPAAFPPFPVTGTYPIADELGVHMSLTPNPDDGTNADDDDVDSLDIVQSQDSCPVWLFTADHEAHLGLDPGSIYEVAGGVPILVIDDVAHLGIPESTDVDGFEFTWLTGPGGGTFLAILFSVDDNDPLTAPDESGGLDPNMIYGSFMTGASFPMLAAADRLADDIDALTIWSEPLDEPCPPITGAESCQTHAAAGRFCIDLLVNNIEPRTTGCTEVDITLAGATGAATATVACNLPYVPAAGFPMIVGLPGSMMTVNLSPALPDQACCTITLADASGDVCGTVDVRTLEGDVDQNGFVNGADITLCKPLLGMPVGPGNFLCDIDANGFINGADLTAIKPNLGHVGCP